MALSPQQVLDFLDQLVFDVCAAKFGISVVRAQMVKLEDIKVENIDGLDHVQITMHVTQGCGNNGEDQQLRRQIFLALAKPMAASISNDADTQISDLESSGRLDLQMPNDYSVQRLGQSGLVGMPQAIFNRQINTGRALIYSFEEEAE